MAQLTEEDAIRFAESGSWESMSLIERGVFQLFQERLCMPFDKWHEGIEAALGRPVWTHEMADIEALRAEWRGEVPGREMQEILGSFLKLAQGKQAIIIVKEESR